MLLRGSSRRFSGSYCLLVLMITSLVMSMPFVPSKRTSEVILDDDGSTRFSDVPKLLEIQLPLRIATKEDLIAWAKYVMSLTASKINITLSTVKDVPRKNSETLTSTNRPFDRSREDLAYNINFPGPRVNDVNSNFGGSTFVGTSNVKNSFTNTDNFRVSGSRMKEPGVTNIPDTRGSTKTRNDQQKFLPRYPDFGTRPANFDENEIPLNGSILTAPPSGMYLPLPVRTTDGKFRNEEYATRYFYDGMERNVSNNFDIATRELSKKIRGNNEERITENIAAIRTNEPQRNLSSVIKPILTLPFEAVITITREENDVATTSSRNEKNNYFSLPIRDPPDEFPPYFEKNYTLANESGQINVVFDDHSTVEVNDKETTERIQKKETRKENSKKERSKKTQDKTRKRQATAVTELLRMLAILRNPTSNNTSTNISPPILTFLKAGAPQKAQIAIDSQFTGGQERSNETSQAQEIEENDDDDNNDYDEEEEGGGSIQALIELLPLVAPILEDLSDPESDTDIGELLQAALPILEDLSQPGEDGEGVDLAGTLVPILLNIVGGKDGEGSDASAVLGPLIQLIAPLIGPIIGPLVGPLSSQSSNPAGEGGSSIGSLVQAVVAPLSQPTGPGKMSPISTVIAGVTASLSKELTNGKSGIDLSALIKAVVSGVLAGTSAGLSGHKDSAVAPTSYGGYGGYGPANVPANNVNPIALIGTSIKDILNAGLKVASSLITAVSGILGASSQEHPHPYGPPPSYGAPKPYVTSSTVQPYAAYQQIPRAPKRQTRP